MPSETRPALGVKDGRLSDCPESPNCVSTQAVRGGQKMDAIPLNVSGEVAMRLIKQVLEELPRTRLVEEQPRYLRVEFTSLVFRFTDDVEFYLDEQAALIHFRSASRVGHWDLGANRKRMEKIVAQFEKLEKQSGADDKGQAD